MATRRALLLVVLLAACGKDTVTENNSPPEITPPNPQGVSVLTQHNDNTRAGLNDNETLLTTSNVNVTHFGKQFSLQVDDQVYAQPLVAGKVDIGGAPHNVVYVATVNNTVYAFDGDNGKLYWQKNFTAPGMRPPTRVDMSGACGGQYTDFSGRIGIVGTPVIDAASHTIYFVARSTNGTAFVQDLHAADILTGTDIKTPTRITATYNGTGDGSVNGVISFNAQRQNQRQALTLVNGIVYVSFSSHCDWGPYHGWILGYDAGTLQQKVVYNATPDGYNAGMWESGMGMAADDAGDLYVVTGNGSVGVGDDPTNRQESRRERAQAHPVRRDAGGGELVHALELRVSREQGSRLRRWRCVPHSELRLLPHRIQGRESVPVEQGCHGRLPDWCEPGAASDLAESWRKRALPAGLL